ncbi:hypothetical protein BP6252_11210 [Coleophoma cylindrospora]|uniref:RTA1-domain-containing protein n=1 Tax=Coleophoma cylindrospora TaxID=1849047 RepID=A0A3D8QPD4_9HELO|nr:hypothetical protein BP6252_11210 [Coleophoma cylindrospora]
MANTAAPISNCTLETCPLSDAYVNYDPSLVANTLYLALFSAFLLIHVIQGYRYRAWTYTIAVVLGLVGEIIGYVARVQMHFNPFLANPFLMYLSCITIAPVFFSAAIYLCLSRVVVVYGVEYSRFKPRTYTVIFMTCDFTSLVLQAVGGAVADTNLTNLPLQLTGVHVMIAGLAFQVLSLLIFSLLCGEYAWRVQKQADRQGTKYEYLTQTKKFYLFLWGTSHPIFPPLGRSSRVLADLYFALALGFATVFIIIRSAYRLAELHSGFSGALANNEVLLMVFDGAAIVLACIALTGFHAGMAFEGHWGTISSEYQSQKGYSADVEGRDV